ncbi:inorganic phosphate transporter [Flavobacterium sp. I-SCBP12n]|uniref:Phosphate transporter n=2 Tax=Flavobacterium TaxID=237 RepID=A0A9X1XMW5_9FLAO|nr:MULTISPECIES: inorganic phosphate transporter [Flavobacterium]MBP4141238.1 inorganic phosphate transporter [Flavobacterium flabelliforme]MCK8140550.1 inorganic phosphate transporter [Flavobacterium pygoscelis]
MEQIYVIMLIVLGVLAIIDLVVGVSNDAVNFLNSAVGSKAVSFKTTMIVASLGVLVGAMFSSGMMEIARSGIFVPSMFSFNDVMIIFLAVMISDILLLDVFNSLGLPTSTTVSIIFELLGAAVCLALYKIYTSDETLDHLGMYINTKKASTIVYSILLSVILSFSLGSFIQYISRLIFTFHYEKKLKYFGAIFGGVAITAITFFILIKGLKGVSFISSEQFEWIDKHQFLILAVNFAVFLILSQILISYFKVNILRVIILIGTFALALAFAGNDLVNFIGVPIAAFNSYQIFQGSGVSGDSFMMGALANDDIVAPFYFLLLAGVVMVVTLWTSKKAKSVIETGVNLSRQGEGDEKFTPNTASRFIVRFGVYIGQAINVFLPKKLQIKIDKRFESVKKTTKKTDDEPAFDMVRASVNLMVASILISIGTSMKLPLSTTYVTFMVAMGTSFADRAWDRESAVYRIAGVFKVIGGWFFTAIIAFVLAFIMAYILKVGEIFAFVGLLLMLGIMLYNSSRKHKQKIKNEEEIKSLRKEDIGTVKEMITESSAQISKVFRKTSALYSNLIDNLSMQDLAKLKENKKDQKKLEKEIDELKSNVFYLIKNLDDNSVEASKFYILILGYLQDMVQSIDFITTNSYLHVNNNHKKLKFNQIKGLKNIDTQLQHLLQLLEESFKNEDFHQIDTILNDKQALLDTVSDLITKQIKRIRTTETSPKNSKLYFALLLESNDLVKSLMNLLELFKEFNNVNKE